MRRQISQLRLIPPEGCEHLFTCQEGKYSDVDTRLLSQPQKCQLNSLPAIALLYYENLSRDFLYLAGRKRSLHTDLRMDEFPSSTILFASSLRLHRRLPAFTGSVLLHCTLIVVLAFWSVKTPTVEPRVIPPNYSIRFLRFQTPSEHRGGASSIKSPIRSAAAGGSEKSQTSARKAPAASTATSGNSEPAAPTQPAIAREHRQFQLPPQTHVQPVTQTLVQMDVPPQIVLKHEIPLPTVVLWTQPKPAPPMRKQFVAPPVKKTLRWWPKVCRLLRPWSRRIRNSRWRT